MDLLRLNFQPGISVQAIVRHRFGKPVNFFPVRGLKKFFLLVSVSRWKFCLCEKSIDLILQATLGGTTVDFRTQQISTRVFRFVVASKNMAFHVYNLRHFTCDQYQIIFNL
jgi:hypothetical protein